MTITLEVERKIAAHITPGFILHHDLTITDFTEGSDLPGPDLVSPELKRTIRKYAHDHGIRAKILRSAIYSELARYDVELPAGGLVVYLSSQEDTVIMWSGVTPIRIIR